MPAAWDLGVETGMLWRGDSSASPTAAAEAQQPKHHRCSSKNCNAVDTLSTGESVMHTYVPHVADLP